MKFRYRANVDFYDDSARVRFSLQEWTVGHEGLSLEISCTPSDWQLSYLAQVCSSSLPSLSTVEHLKIFSYRSHWQDDIESTQWLELLSPFASVTNLVLFDGLVPLVAPALQELAGERVTEVLPMLQRLHLEGPRQRKHVEEAVRQFITARQLSGHPVAVLDQKFRQRQRKRQPIFGRELNDEVSVIAKCCCFPFN